MQTEQTKLTGLRGLKNTEPVENLTGNTAEVIAAELKAGLTAFEEKLTGLKAEVKELKDAKPADLEPLAEELKGLKAKLTELSEKKDPDIPDHSEDLKGIKARLDILDNTMASPGGAAPARPKTLGEEICDAAGFKAVTSKTAGGQATYRHELHKSVQLGGIKSLLSGVKAAPTLGDSELGALNWSYRQQEIVREARESVAAFVPKIGVVSTPGQLVYEWPRETADSATGFLRTTLTTALTGGTTPVATCEVGDASHFMPGTDVRFFNAAREILGTLTLVSIDDVSVPNTLTFAAGAIDWDQDAGTNITSEYWAGTGESEQKPHGLFAGDTTSTNLVNIATMTSVSRQQLLSPAGIQAWIDQDMPERWRRNAAYQLLYGTGPSNKQLPGFWTAAGAQTYAWSSGAVGDNRLDAILSAILLIVGGNITIVMNKRDVNELRKLKDTTGNYLRQGNLGMITLDRNAAGNMVIDGLYEIVESDAVKDGDFLVVDFALASKIPDSEDEALEVGLVNNQFAINERTIRYEHTIGHAIQRLGSFVLGSFDSAPT